ncbi:MAG: response regulator [Ferruginibacter sp.]
MPNIRTSKIFVVDDDVFSLHIYGQYLNNLGCEDVMLFQSGEDCLSRIIEQPDIILVDYRMPPMDGLELLQKIKVANPDIYVVFILAFDDIETAVRSLKEGAFDYIIKGEFEAQHLKKVLDKIFHVKKMLLNNNAWNNNMLHSS